MEQQSGSFVFVPTIFRFLDLPREIRCIVYEHALSLDSIDLHFQRYLETGRQALSVHRRCSSVWLMNKETHDEVTTVGQSLTLSFGVPRLSLTAFITPHRLQKLTHITMSDSGFQSFEVQPRDFDGLLRAVSDLAKALRKGHSLQSVKISLRSQYVKDRLCNNQAQGWTRSFCRYLQEIRGVRRVNVDVDLPAGLKQPLVDTMTSKARGFLSLPFGIRKRIYLHAADYNEAIKHIRGIARKSMTTPTILQLNHQTSAEAIQAIFSIPLVLSGLAATEIVRIGIVNCISVETLRRIKYARLEFVQYEQLHILQELVPLFNDGCPLTSFELRYHEPSVRRMCRATGKIYPTDELRTWLKPLEQLRVGGSAIIVGTLPKCYSDPLCLNMMPNINNAPPYRLVGIAPNGKKVVLSIAPARVLRTDIHSCLEFSQITSSQKMQKSNDALDLRELPDSEVSWSDYDSDDADEIEHSGSSHDRCELDECRDDVHPLDSWYNIWSSLSYYSP